MSWLLLFLLEPGTSTGRNRRVMQSDDQTIQLRTWTPRQPVREHGFYVLSKGENAGRPMEKSCPNCFVINCKSIEERNCLYGLCVALWQGGSFRHYLRGSVIPFILIRHAEALISNAYKEYRQAPERKRLQIETLRKLDALEQTKNKEVELIRELKHTLARKHFHVDLNIAETFTRRRRTSIN